MLPEDVVTVEVFTVKTIEKTHTEPISAIESIVRC
jgi:hypothetical protein